MLDATDPQRELRHVLATLAYRATRSLQDPPEEFATLRLSNTTRTPLEIVSHMADLLEWALRRARAEPGPRADTSGEWSREVARFYEAARALDAHLASSAPLGCAAEKLLQGPLADALTHVGQLAMLRGLAGSPVRGESYFDADIRPGQVGPERADSSAACD
ncbi:hypothetical protein BH20GEM2_BH20GEM2_12020 [soil metagenome]